MTFKNLLDSEESDDKAITAMGILTNFDTMISVIESKEVSNYTYNPFSHKFPCINNSHRHHAFVL